MSHKSHQPTHNITPRSTITARTPPSTKCKICSVTKTDGTGVEKENSWFCDGCVSKTLSNENPDAKPAPKIKPHSEKKSASYQCSRCKQFFGQSDVRITNSTGKYYCITCLEEIKTKRDGREKPQDEDKLKAPLVPSTTGSSSLKPIVSSALASTSSALVSTVSEIVDSSKTPNVEVLDPTREVEATLNIFHMPGDAGQSDQTKIKQICFSCNSEVDDTSSSSIFTQSGEARQVCHACMNQYRDMEEQERERNEREKQERERKEKQKQEIYRKLRAEFNGGVAGPSKALSGTECDKATLKSSKQGEQLPGTSKDNGKCLSVGDARVHERSGHGNVFQTSSVKVPTALLDWDGSSKKAESLRSNLSKTTTLRRKAEQELLDIVRLQKEKSLMTLLTSEEDECLKVLEEIRQKKLLVQGRLDQEVHHAREMKENASTTSTELNATIRTNDWVDNHSRPTQSGDHHTEIRGREQTTLERPRSSRPFNEGVRWEDLDVLRTTVMEERPDQSRRNLRSSTPAVTATKSSNDFYKSMNQTLHQGENAALSQIRKLLPEQLVARRYLPKELPTFHGDPAEWPKFISAYLESQSHCNYSDRENCMRLLPALKGDAYKLVGDLLSHPENIERALNTLRTVFGNPEKIRQAIGAKLRALPVVRDDDLEGFTWLASKIKGYCSTLRAARLEREIYNADCLAEIEGKIPVHVRISWGLYKRSQPECDLETLADWLTGIGEATVMLGKPSKPAPLRSQTDAPRSQLTSKRKPERLYVHSSLSNKEECPTTMSKAEKVRQNKCSKCEGQHALVNCGDFKDMLPRLRYDHAAAKHLCFKCLEPHSYQRCKNKRQCGVHGCTRRHHPLLHKNEEQRDERPTPAAPTEGNIHHHNEVTSETLFRIIPVKLYGPNEVAVDTYALLDEGSSVTLIEEDMADKLGADGPKEELCLKWTGTASRTEKFSRRISIGVSTVQEESRSFSISGVRTVGSLNLPKQSVTQEFLKDIDEFKGLPIPTYDHAKPSILVGIAHWQLTVPVEYRGADAGVVATRSFLGWAVSGKTGNDSTERVHFHECGCCDQELMEKLFQRFFQLECQGLQSPERFLESDENVRARNILHSTCKKLLGRYEIGLLWRHQHIELPDSRPMALRRHLCLERKLLKDEDTYKIMRETMKDYVNKGYARILSVNEAAKTSQKTWYLPIFTVTNPNKPGKIRVVWDAAAKSGGISLNECLMSGPDLLCSLTDVLRKFREYKVAVTGDIREMFHQVKIRRDDQDAQRFLWRDFPNEDIKTYVMEVMTFGATCSPTSAQFVKNVNAEKFKSRYPEAVYDILNCHYVDDYVSSYDDLESAARIAHQVRRIQREAGFILRGFNSNSDKVLVELGEKCKKEEEKDLAIGEKEESKVLGLRWNPRDDTLFYRFNWGRLDGNLVNGTRKPTKRELLRHLMMVFDPLGLIANLLVQLKLLLQEVHRSVHNWDDQISHEQARRWNWWLEAVKELEKVQIPRCYGDDLSLRDPPKAQLHVLVDASERVYAAVAYIRVVLPKGPYCTLIGAKTKLAPTKPTSIPRLELMAAVLGVRLANSIVAGQRIKFETRTFWTDSQNVLCWIRSEARNFKQFVSFRIGEILEETTVAEWRYVPTKLNVADDCTKLKTSINLSKDSVWFAGPEFLRADPSLWPEMPEHLTGTETQEIRAVHHHQEQQIVKLGNVEPDLNRISKWTVAVRTQARVLRVIRRKKPLSKEEFDPEELREAELELIRYCQRDVYLDEIKILLNDPDAQLPKSNRLYELSPFLDPTDGILRLRSRIQRAGVVYDQRNPIILPRGHRLTRLIIDQYHRQLKHLYSETVVNEIRSKYFISQLRVDVKKVIADCQYCKNKRARPQIPLMADLPTARLADHTRPFTYTGLDYFGPVDLMVNRSTKKHWGVLFTCLTTRAVHLELTSSLKSDMAILAVERFISRRGEPSEIHCDNATTFKGVDAELMDLPSGTDWSEVREKLYRIKWKYITPAAPHMGGSWERMIRSIKTTLKHILKCRKPSPEVFSTALCEVENILNSRPLTYVPILPDGEVALTPNHILLGQASGIRPLGILPERKVPLTKLWQVALDIANAFWVRWMREYLPTLTRRTKWFKKVKPLQVGDVGVIWDPAIRNSWQLGRVVNIVEAKKDRQVRTVEIKTSKGFYRRPVSKFAKLDVCEQQHPPAIHEGGNVGN